MAVSRRIENINKSADSHLKSIKKIDTTSSLIKSVGNTLVSAEHQHVLSQVCDTIREIINESETYQRDLDSKSIDVILGRIASLLDEFKEEFTSTELSQLKTEILAEITQQTKSLLTTSFFEQLKTLFEEYSVKKEIQELKEQLNKFFEKQNSNNKKEESSESSSKEEKKEEIEEDKEEEIKEEETEGEEEKEEEIKEDSSENFDNLYKKIEKQLDFLKKSVENIPSKSTGNILKSFKKFSFGNITKGISSLGNKLKSLKTGISSSIKGFGAKIKGLGSKIGGTLAAPFKKVGSFFKNPFKKSDKALKDKKEKSKDKIFNTISKIIEKLWSTLEPFIEKAVKFAALIKLKVILPLTLIFLKFLLFASIIAAVIGFIIYIAYLIKSGKLWQKLKAIIGKLWEWTKDLASWIWEKLQQFGEWIWENLPDWLANLWEWTKDFGGWLWEKLKQLGEWIGENIGEWLSNLWEWTKDFGKWLWDKFKQFWSWVWDCICKAWEWTKDFGKWLWDKLVAAIKYVFFGMWVDLGKWLWGKLKSFGKWLYDKYIGKYVVKPLKKLLAPIKKFWDTKIWPVIKPFVQSLMKLYNSIKKCFAKWDKNKSFWENMKNMAVLIKQAIVDWWNNSPFKKFYDKYLSPIIKSLKDLMSRLKNLWNSFKWDSNKSFVENLMSFWYKIKAAIKDWWNNSIIKQYWDKLCDWISNLWKKVKDWWNSTSIGKWINGLSAKISAAKEKFGNTIWFEDSKVLPAIRPFGFLVGKSLKIDKEADRAVEISNMINDAKKQSIARAEQTTDLIELFKKGEQSRALAKKYYDQGNRDAGKIRLDDWTASLNRIQKLLTPEQFKKFDELRIQAFQNKISQSEVEAYLKEIMKPVENIDKMKQEEGKNLDKVGSQVSSEVAKKEEKQEQQQQEQAAVNAEILREQKAMRKDMNKGFSDPAVAPMPVLVGAPQGNTVYMESN